MEVVDENYSVRFELGVSRPRVGDDWTVSVQRVRAQRARRHREGLAEFVGSAAAGAMRGLRWLVGGAVDLGLATGHATVDVAAGAARGVIGAVEAAGGVERIAMGVVAVAVVADNRVGYITQYRRSVAAAVLAAAVLRRAGQRRYETLVRQGRQLHEMSIRAVATLSRFLRRTEFIYAGRNRQTLVGLASNISLLDSDQLNALLRHQAPRIQFGPDPEPLPPGGGPDSGGGPSGPPPPGAATGGGAESPRPPAADGAQAFKRGPLLSWRFGWRDRMEDRERAAEGVAQFIGIGTNGEQDIPMVTGQGFWTRLANRMVGRSHKSYHRASNKFVKRARVLRLLREEMIFAGVGHKRERTALNVAAAEELARKVVSNAIDGGVVDKGDARWYRSGLVESFFVKDDDDQFWAGIAAAPTPIRA